MKIPVIYEMREDGWWWKPIVGGAWVRAVNQEEAQQLAEAPNDN